MASRSRDEYESLGLCDAVTRREPCPKRSTENLSLLQFSIQGDIQTVRISSRYLLDRMSISFLHSSASLYLDGVAKTIFICHSYTDRFFFSLAIRKPLTPLFCYQELCLATK